MEVIEPEYFKSLQWILDNSIDGILDLTFSCSVEEFGAQKEVDLKPDGRNIPVTDANKKEYVQLVSAMKMTSSIRMQIDSFLEGFHDVIPATAISIFDDQQLELLISGLPDIDVEDWKANTEYANNGYNESSAQVQWFWRAVRSATREEKAKLLQFITGTSKVPLEGFKALEGVNGVQKFNIHKDFGATDRLPQAHTW